MNIKTSLAFVTFSALPSILGGHLPEPQPVVMVAKINMPQNVPQSSLINESNEDSEVNVVSLYRSLKDNFHLSNTTMANWLGVKRRTLYNWLNCPEKSKQYGNQIEERLATLEKLRSEMEPEHHEFLYKIAFSPIYGNPEFGKMILSGAPETTLTYWYDELFSQFESYRKISGKSQALA